MPAGGLRMLKHILDFILNEERLHLFFIHLAWIAPVIGISTGAAIRHFRRGDRMIVMKGCFWGFLGSFISLLWWIYNRIMNHYGLDSVKALLINFALFIVCGLLLGLLYRRIQTAGDGQEAD